MQKRQFTEQELIVLLKAKDQKGFDLLYTRYSGSLYMIALKIVHQEAIAQDVLQDSFVKIWKHIASYNASKGSLFTFILNITRNTAIDKTRSLAYQHELKGFTLKDDIMDSRDATYQQVEHIGVGKFVEALSPPYKQLINYVYLQGYTHKQAATALHIPLGTAKTRLKKAITQLQLMML